jgi:hypothetical protein
LNRRPLTTENNMAEPVVGTMLLLTIFGIILAVVWIILPFAIFGTKPILRDIGDQAHRTTELLASIDKRLKYLADVVHEGEQRAGRG